ncbi:MAG: TatD family hydrolase, partial [Nannocystaceae bacterium]
PIRLFFALGVHPFALENLHPSGDQHLFEQLRSRLSARPANVRGVGECGLDYTLKVDRERQKAVLISQIELASRFELPLILHCVRAHDDLLHLLQEHGAPPSVVHGFSGSTETASRWVRAGHMVGFGPLVTHPRARRVLAAARDVPATHLLIETDAPDQTPFQRRPATNEPAFLPDVVAELAALRACTPEDIARTSWHNAERIFGPFS